MKRDVEERPHARTDWRYMTVVETVQEHNRQYEGLSIEDLAAKQQKHPLDALLDLALDEGLQTTFSHIMSNRGEAALARRIASPYSHISLSDGGATSAISPSAPGRSTSWATGCATGSWSASSRRTTR